MLITTFTFFWFCNISTQRQLMFSHCSSFYGVCISIMHFHLHGAKVSGNVLIYQFAFTIIILIELLLLLLAECIPIQIQIMNRMVSFIQSSLKCNKCFDRLS